MSVREDLPLDWEELKMKKAEESGYRCDVCGRDAICVVLERDPREHEDAGFEMENLQTTCRIHSPDDVSGRMYIGLPAEDVELPGNWTGVKRTRLAREEGCRVCGGLEREMYVAPTVEEGTIELYNTELYCDDHVPEKWERSEMVVDGRKVDDVDLGMLDDGGDAGEDGVAGTFSAVELVGSGFSGVYDVRAGLAGIAAGVLGVGAGAAASVFDVGVPAWLVGVVVFGVAYAAGLLMRDYGDESWPGVEWVPRDRGVLRPVSVGLVLAAVGVAGDMVGVGAGWVGESAVDVLWAVGVLWMLMQARYVMVMGVRDGAFDGYAWLWDVVLRVSAVAGAAGVVGLAPVWVQAVVVGAGAAFVGRARWAGVEWRRPLARGETGPVERVKLRVLQVWDRVVTVVERARENEVAGVERGED